MPIDSASTHFGIKIYLLPNDVRRHYDAGTETDTVNPKTVKTYLSERLAGRKFNEPNWPRAIDAEKLEPEVKVNDKIVYAARTTQGARVMYVTHKTPKPSEEEWIIVLAILPQHGYEKCPILSNSAPQLANDIADAIAIVEAPKIPKTNDAADTPHPPVSQKKQMALTASQQRILEKMGEHCSGLVFSPGGVGKTTLLVAWLKTKIDSGQVARCFVTTPDVKQLVLASLNVESTHPLLTVQTWDEFRAEQASYSPAPSTHNKKPLVYFEESENTAQKTPCFLTWFEQQFPQQKKTSGKKKSGDLPHYDPEILWAEFTRVIFQLSDPYSPEKYHALGERESHYKKDERRAIYAAFSSYLTYAHNLKTHYEPHENDHQILLSTDGAIIKTLGIDEVQAAPTTLVKAALKLTRPQTQLLWVGDAEQDTGLSVRTRKPIEDALQERNIHYQSFQLVANLRSATKPIDTANLLLYLKNALLGSKERDTTFFLDSSEAMKEGAFVYMPAVSPSFSNNVKSDARFAVLVPDEIADSELEQLKKIWGNHLFRVSDSRGLEWDHVILTGFSDDLLKPLEEAVFAHQALRNGFPPLPKELVFARKTSNDNPEKSAQIEKVLSQLYTAVTRAKENIYFCGMDSTVFQNMETHLYPTHTVAADDRDEAAQVVFQKSTPREWFNIAKEYIVEKQMATKGFSLLWTADVWGTIEQAAAAQKLVTGLKAEVIIAQVDLALSTDNPLLALRTFITSTKKVIEKTASVTQRPLTLFSSFPVAQSTHEGGPAAAATRPSLATQPTKSNLTKIQEEALKKVDVELKRKNPSATAAKAALLSTELWGNNPKITNCIQSLLFPEDHKKTIKYCEEILTFVKHLLEKDVISVCTFFQLKKEISSKKESNHEANFAEKIRKELSDPETTKAALKQLIGRFLELLNKGTDEALNRQYDALALAFRLYDKAVIQAVFFSPDTTGENNTLLQLMQRFMITANAQEMRSTTFFLILKKAVEIAPDNAAINRIFRITLLTDILRCTTTQDIGFTAEIERLLDHPIFTVTDDLLSVEPLLQHNLLSVVVNIYLRLNRLTSYSNDASERLEKLFFDLITKMSQTAVVDVFLQSEGANEIPRLTSMLSNILNKIKVESEKYMAPTPDADDFLETVGKTIIKNAHILFTLSKILTHLSESSLKSESLTLLASDLFLLVSQLISLCVWCVCFEKTDTATSYFSSIFLEYTHSLESLCQECKKAGITSAISITMYQYFKLIQNAYQTGLADAMSCVLSIAHIIPNFTKQFMHFLTETPSDIHQFSIMLQPISATEISMVTERFYKSSGAHPPIYTLCFTTRETGNKSIAMQFFMMAVVLSAYFAEIAQAKNNGDHTRFERGVNHLTTFYDCLSSHFANMALLVRKAVNQKRLIDLLPSSIQSENPALYDTFNTIANSLSGITLASLIGMTCDALFEHPPQIAYDLSRILKEMIGSRMDYDSITALSSKDLALPTVSPNETARWYVARLNTLSDPNLANLLLKALTNLCGIKASFGHHFSPDTVFSQWLSHLEKCYLQILKTTSEMTRTIIKSTAAALAEENDRESVTSTRSSSTFFPSTPTTHTTYTTNVSPENRQQEQSSKKSMSPTTNRPQSSTLFGGDPRSLLPPPTLVEALPTPFQQLSSRLGANAKSRHA